MPIAALVVRLARACPGLYTEHQILWHLPLAKVHALLHAAAILDGTPMIWPDPTLSRTGRWFQRVKALFTRRPLTPAAP